jgi:hypothetical protein
MSLLVRREVAVLVFVEHENDQEGWRAYGLRIDHNGAFRVITPG